MEKGKSIFIEGLLKDCGRQIDFILSAIKCDGFNIDEMRWDIASSLAKAMVMSRVRNKNLGVEGKSITLINETLLFKLATIVKSAVSWEEFCKRVLSIPYVKNPRVLLNRFNFKWNLKFEVPSLGDNGGLKVKSASVVDVGDGKKQDLCFSEVLLNKVKELESRVDELSFNLRELTERVRKHSHLKDKVVIINSF